MKARKKMLQVSGSFLDGIGTLHDSFTILFEPDPLQVVSHNARFFGRYGPVLDAKEREGNGGGDKGDKGKGDESDKGDEDSDEEDADEEGEDSDEEDADEEGATVPKEQYDALMKETKNRKAELKKQAAKIGELEANSLGKDEVESFRKWQKEAQSRDKDEKAKKGQYETLLKEATEKHATEIKSKDESISKLTKTLEKARIDGELARIIPEYTDIPVADVLPIIRPFLNYDPETDTIEIEDGDGEHPLNDKGKEMTLEEFVEREIGKRPHFAKSDAAGGSGGKTQKGKGLKRGKISGPELQKMDTKTRREFMAKARGGDEAALEASRR